MGNTSLLLVKDFLGIRATSSQKSNTSDRAAARQASEVDGPMLSHQESCHAHLLLCSEALAKFIQVLVEACAALGCLHTRSSCHHRRHQLDPVAVDIGRFNAQEP